MTQKERDEILIKLLVKTQENEAKLDANIKETKEIKEKLGENIKETKELKTNQKSLMEEVQHIGNCVAKIEVEHGDKISALFDAITVYSEKIDEIKEDIKIIRTILNRHEDEIFCLKNA